jgi:hypothetical protein
MLIDVFLFLDQRFPYPMPDSGTRSPAEPAGEKSARWLLGQLDLPEPSDVEFFYVLRGVRTTDRNQRVVRR